MTSGLPGRDIQLALGVLAYTGTGLPGRQLAFDRARAGWHQFAVPRRRPGWWSRLASAWRSPSRVLALASVPAVLLAILLGGLLQGRLLPVPAASTLSAASAHPERAASSFISSATTPAPPVVPFVSLPGKAASGAMGPPTLEPSAPTLAPVVPAQVLAAATPGRLAAPAASAATEAVPEAIRSRRWPAQAARPGPAPGRLAGSRLRHGMRKPARTVLASSSSRRLEVLPESGRAPRLPAAPLARSPPEKDVLVAIQDASTVIVANRRGLPTPFRLGEQLPSGAVLISVDPGRESIETDRGPLRLE